MSDSTAHSDNVTTARRLTAKQAAAVLGVSLSQLTRYRRAGRVCGTPYAGVTRLRYSYDLNELTAFHG